VEVRLAREGGFCFGVRRAVGMVEELLAKGSEPVCLGPLIHNPQMIDRLKRQGLTVAKTPEDVKEGPVVIRSHGVRPEVLEAFANRGIEVVDATCPFVRRVQRRARDLTAGGYSVVIVGESEHPEVQALLGYAPRAVVAGTPSDLRGRRLGRKVGLIAQTTQTRQAFSDVLRYLAGRSFSELRSFDTVCRATATRLREAARVARWAELMVVLGGRRSANTRRMAALCGRSCPRTLHLESVDELDRGMLAGVERVGVAAGASTPDFVVEGFLRALS